VNPAIFSLPFLKLLQGFYNLWTLLKTGLVFWLCSFLRNWRIWPS
jgi:hypothetical protein